MRSIKFRAWDNNQMYYQVQAGGFEDTVASIFVDKNGVMEWVNASPGYIVMQFTGLKDKNGKEIYEGDIFILGDMNIKYVVEWINCCLCGRQIGNKSTVGLDYWQDKINIIGNIYENPELLEAK